MNGTWLCYLLKGVKMKEPKRCNYKYLGMQSETGKYGDLLKYEYIYTIFYHSLFNT